jgi:CSLREA domain-containing protein
MESRKWLLTAVVAGFIALMTSAWVTTANAQTTFAVNTSDDTDDGTCDTGHCSLREAINSANALPGTDTIEFNIPGAGPHTIQPTEVLPTITDPAVLDGYTQPGAGRNTNPLHLGTNAVLKIEIDGSNLEGAGAGLRVGLNISAGSTTVRGLVINRCSWGITLNIEGGNVIEGNFIGTDVTGTTALSNHFGIHIYNWSPNNIIGGASPGACNLISGNSSDGVTGYGHSNIVQGNLIGTDATGTVVLGNSCGVCLENSDGHSVSDNLVAYGYTGISLYRTSNSTVKRNHVRSSKDNNGISVIWGSGNEITANHVTGNAGAGIKLDRITDGTVANNIVAGNGTDGIHCLESSAQISNNTIVDNATSGIFCDGTSSATVTNSILWGNGDDLNGCEATYSDIRDGDSGEGNISIYPMFADPEGDYHLLDYSECVGAGTTDGAPDTDAEGNPRPNPPASQPDMGAYENGRGTPGVAIDTDGDGLVDGMELLWKTNPDDMDSDDDGISDGEEDANQNGILDNDETDPTRIDTDNDGIQDGTEQGRTAPLADPDGAGPLLGTAPETFIPDADPSTTTHPRVVDTDGDGLADGEEDKNHDGGLDSGETDPASPLNDIFGLEDGNTWAYTGGDTTETAVVELDLMTFSPTATYVMESTSNGSLEREWYERTAGEVKLRGQFVSDLGFLRYSQGLVSYWYPMEVGDRRSSSAEVELEFPELGITLTLDVSLIVDVLEKESVTLEFGTFEAYKLRGKARVWGYDIDERETSYQWVVPYLGVVKYDDGDGTWELSAFSIGRNTVSQDTDVDGDGLKDFEELLSYGTNWQSGDTDNDGCPDGVELFGQRDPLVRDPEGDVNIDGLVDLQDALLVLQVAAGPGNLLVFPGADVNGDGRISVEETVFILQKIAGLR